MTKCPSCKTENVDLADLKSSSAEVKYTCAKNLIAVSKVDPAQIYPHLDTFAELLDSDKNVMKWTGTIIIGNLAKVDSDKKIDGLLGKLISLLNPANNKTKAKNAGGMITANNAIIALGEIALAKPEYQEQITRAMLEVEHYVYDTDECRNIAMGKVLESIGPYAGKLKDPKDVVEFARRQTTNTRAATKKKAEQLLKKLGK